jgi:hypothetical protein
MAAQLTASREGLHSMQVVTYTLKIDFMSTQKGKPFWLPTANPFTCCPVLLSSVVSKVKLSRNRPWRPIGL